MFKCNKCGSDFRIGTEKVGNDSNGLPIIHRFGYCDHCMIKQDLDMRQQVVKKRDSTLSIISCVFVGVGAIIPLPVIVSFVLILAGVIVGLIDLCINNKSERHIGAWFALIFGVLSVFVMFL